MSHNQPWGFLRQPPSAAMAGLSGRSSRPRDSVSASTKLRKRKQAFSRAAEPASKKRIVSSTDHLNQDAQETARSMTCVSKFENLPTELLQQIFFASLNGNLLTASPYLARKLSSQNVYCAAFCIAFHHQDILDLRTRFKLHYLLPEVPVPIPFWELRSMVRAVLDSRWCNIRWVNQHFYCQLDTAMNIFRKDYATRRDHVTSQTMELLSQRELSLQDLRYRVCLGTGRLGGANELRTDALDIHILSRSTDSLTTVLDENEEPWEETEHFRLVTYAFGDIPLSWSFINNACGYSHTFRDAVLAGSFLHCSSPRPEHPEIFGELLNNDHIQRALTARRSLNLRQHLQIEYFFGSQQETYKIDPQVYRAAVDSDNKAISEFTPNCTQDQQYLVQILYSIDPYSLPLDSASSQVQAWVAHARERVAAFNMKRREARVDLYFLKEEDELTDQILKSARSDFRREDLANKWDRDIIHYVATGTVLHDPLPLGVAMMEPVLWGKNEPIDERELVATEREANFDDDDADDEFEVEDEAEAEAEESTDHEGSLAVANNVAVGSATNSTAQVQNTVEVAGSGAVQGDDVVPDFDYTGAEEDTNLYCHCQAQSFENMIACDNDDCRYEWFHFACVGITVQPQVDERWYCPDCRVAPDNSGQKSPSVAVNSTHSAGK